ncbi:MAG: GntR family transcriptional regulator [Gammaproteobacteria bacterium]|jgi:DNA-binding GntR family transcriptional regulator|nr:GntR family transcriptional regulator [Gammaproteobacteria bacterium]
MSSDALKDRSKEIVRKPRLSDQIYDLLRRDLRLGRYSMSSTFNELAIAKALDTSRTPVREALVQLVGNGLLEESDRGYRLPRLSTEAFEQLMAVRIVIETTIAADAAAKAGPTDLVALRSAAEAERGAAAGTSSEFVAANNAFRSAFFDSGHNPYLKEVAELFNDRVQAFRIASLEVEENRRATTNHHKRLVQAIGARDAKSARATVESLLRLAIKAFEPVPKEES